MNLSPPWPLPICLQHPGALAATCLLLDPSPNLPRQQLNCSGTSPSASLPLFPSTLFPPLPDTFLHLSSLQLHLPPCFFSGSHLWSLSPPLLWPPLSLHPQFLSQPPCYLRSLTSLLNHSNEKTRGLIPSSTEILTPALLSSECVHGKGQCLFTGVNSRADCSTPQHHQIEVCGGFKLI